MYRYSRINGKGAKFDLIVFLLKARDGIFRITLLFRYTIPLLGAHAR